MLPTCTPVKCNTLNIYAPREISHDPQTKNSRKFIIMSRILIFTMILFWYLKACCRSQPGVGPFMMVQKRKIKNLVDVCTLL